jgi:hypothetical protein
LGSGALEKIRRIVAAAGFDALPRTRAGGRLSGVLWHGRQLRGNDRLPSAEVHYLRHVKEWPPETSLGSYVKSLADVVLDSRTGVLSSTLQDQAQLTFVRRSLELRGLLGNEWVRVEFRVDQGF